MSIRAVFFLSSPGHAPQVDDTPAPFARIAGVELMTRQILTALKNGAEKVFLAPGDHGARAAQLLSRDERLRDQARPPDEEVAVLVFGSRAPDRFAEALGYDFNWLVP